MKEKTDGGYMMNIAEIPSNYYIAARELNKRGFSYVELKSAAQFGGVLIRHVSKKTHRVFYKSKNMQLF